MKKTYLLDADAIINLTRTSCLTNTDKLIELECPRDCKYVSTKEVKDEVLRNLKKTKDKESIATFFHGKEQKLISLANDFFKKIDLADTKESELTTLFNSTDLSNLGERSLAILLFSKYKGFLNKNNNVDTISIISNNKKDIVPFVNKILKLESYRELNFKQNSHIKNIYHFYSDIFRHHKIGKAEIMYFYFISNIDARFTNPDMIDLFKQFNDYSHQSEKIFFKTGKKKGV